MASMLSETPVEEFDHLYDETRQTRMSGEFETAKENI